MPDDAAPPWPQICPSTLRNFAGRTRNLCWCISTVWLISLGGKRSMIRWWKFWWWVEFFEPHQLVGVANGFQIYDSCKTMFVRLTSNLPLCDFMGYCSCMASWLNGAVQLSSQFALSLMTRVTSSSIHFSKTPHQQPKQILSVPTMWSAWWSCWRSMAAKTTSQISIHVQ